jgi:hypothetical protein
MDALRRRAGLRPKPRVSTMHHLPLRYSLPRLKPDCALKSRLGHRSEVLGGAECTGTSQASRDAVTSQRRLSMVAGCLKSNTSLEWPGAGDERGGRSLSRWVSKRPLFMSYHVAPRPKACSNRNRNARALARFFAVLPRAKCDQKGRFRGCSKIW